MVRLVLFLLRTPAESKGKISSYQPSFLWPSGTEPLQTPQHFVLLSLFKKGNWGPGRLRD